MNRCGVALLLAALIAGCASPGPSPPRPSGTPQPEVPQTPDAEVPSTPEPPAAPPPRARSDTEAPTLALLRQSDRAASSGDLEGAIAYVERAIRLDSRDAELWLKLARLQLEAERPATAEQLAQKAIALAGNRDALQRQGWLLVADAKAAQGEDDDAAQIRARWQTYRG